MVQFRHRLPIILGSDSVSGKVRLPQVVQEYRRDYQTLSHEDKENIVKEFEQHKQNKTFGLRVSARSKVNDITQTLKRVENEVRFFLPHFPFWSANHESRSDTSDDIA